MEQEGYGSDELLIVQALLRSDTMATSHRSWLTIIDAKRVVAAIDRYDKRVFLVDVARTFAIQYRGTNIWLQPADGAFVPCGMFVITDMRRRVAESHALRSIA